MTSTEVHVILTGIVSLIPNAATKTWTIRLHDVRSKLHPHFPSVVVERDNLSEKPKPEFCKKLTNGVTLYGWRLNNGEINIKSTIVSPAIKSLKPLPNVLSIEKACGSARHCPIAKPFKGVCLAITRGSLEATKLEDDMWQWVGSPPPAWIAEEVCWHFKIRGKELEIELPGIGSPLKIGATPNGNIELRLQNTLDKDIFPTTGKPKQSPDPHVGLYFDESAAPPSPLPELRNQTGGNKPVLPKHAAHRLTSCKIGTNDPLGGTNEPIVSLRVNCPPAQWNG